MEKSDARKQTREEVQARRLEVVHLLLEGIPVMQIVERTGLSWTAVNAAIKRYQANGQDDLKPGARGRRLGTGRVLTAEQEANIRQLLRQRPWYHGLKDHLWDRDSVKLLISGKHRITLSDRSVDNYLNRWGLTLHKPNQRPYERCTKRIRAWLDEHYADIQRRAQSEDGDIFWIDKPVRLDPEKWNPANAGHTQGAENSSTGRGREKVSMVAAVNNQGKVRWLINDGPFVAAKESKFLSALRRDTKKSVLFVIPCYFDFSRSEGYYISTLQKPRRRD